MVSVRSWLKLDARLRVTALAVEERKRSLHDDPCRAAKFQFFLIDLELIRHFMRPYLQERYALEDGRYALYFGEVRVQVTGALALLVDAKLGALITHGDPAAVCSELEELRSIALSAKMSHCEKDWLLLVGRPEIAAVNAALAGTVDLPALRAAFSNEREQEAAQLTRELIQRLQRPL